MRENNYTALVSNTTSAISDLIILGYNTFALIDKKGINLSPFRGSKEINFIKNFRDILDNNKIKSKKIDNYIDECDQFYYYSKDLNLWQNLINEP